MNLLSENNNIEQHQVASISKNANSTQVDITKQSQSKGANIVTLFKGCLELQKPLGYSTLDNILKEVRNENNGEQKQLSEKLLNLYKTDRPKYKSLKEKECLAFILGRFSERKNESCEEYIPLMAFDIDASGDQVFKTLEKLSQSPFVYAAFLSPSRAGLRFVVRTDNRPEIHKKTYQTIADYFSEFLEIPTDKGLRKELQAQGLTQGQISSKAKEKEHIDTSTNNLARLWFYTYVPEVGFYSNPKAKTFSNKRINKNQETPSFQSMEEPLTDFRKIEICRDKVARQNLAGGRNNFVFAFAAELVKHGVGEELALRECLQFIDSDFTEYEIKKTVSSAYKSKSKVYTDEQIKKYAQLTGGDSFDSKSKEGEIPEGKKKERNSKNEDYTNKPKFLRIKHLLSERYDFRFNSVSLDIEISKKDKNDFQVLNENDLVCELLEAGFAGVETPLMALLRSSFVPQYDPFKEYFEGLPEWMEGDKDYIEELAGFIDAKDQEWFNSQFKKMLVRTVACSIHHIPFNKQCFIFKGWQNDGKTTFVRFLCPPKLREYITETIDVNNKDGRLALCLNFIINLDELSKLPRNEVNKVKALITVQGVKERLPYDRKPTKILRRASFFGSTNDDEFLTDSTGNVRWLVMELNKNGVKHGNGGENGYNQQIDIDMVYAQAYALLKSGFQFEMTKQEIEFSEKNNQGFQVLSIEQELIQKFFIPASKDEEGAEFLNATDILKTIEQEVKNTLNNYSIGKALKILGFERTQKFSKNHGYQIKGYWIKRMI